MMLATVIYYFHVWPENKFFHVKTATLEEDLYLRQDQLRIRTFHSLLLPKNRKVFHAFTSRFRRKLYDMYKTNFFFITDKVIWGERSSNANSFLFSRHICIVLRYAMWSPVSGPVHAWLCHAELLLGVGLRLEIQGGGGWISCMPLLNKC